MPSSLYKKAILDLIEYIKGNEQGTKLEGIFRKNPSAQAKKDAKNAILLNRKTDDIFQEIKDPHTPSNLIKEYLKLLSASEPFFSVEVVEEIAAIESKESSTEDKDAEKLDVISNSLKELDDEKKLILSILFEFLHQVKHVEENLMTSIALGTCIGPNLVDPELSSNLELLPAANSIVQIALDNYDGISEILNIDDAKAQQIQEDWDKDIRAKLTFIDDLKSTIDGNTFKVGLFGGEKFNNKLLPKHMKEIYLLCQELKDDNLDETVVNIRNILEVQAKGQKGHLLFLHRRDPATQRFYENFLTKAKNIGSELTEPASDAAENRSLLQP